MPLLREQLYSCGQSGHTFDLVGSQTFVFDLALSTEPRAAKSQRFKTVLETVFDRPAGMIVDSG
jgi:hypothetical protein